MKLGNINLKIILLIFLALNFINLMAEETIKPIINKIIIEGNKYIKREAILNKLPYKEGTEFDPDKSGDAINLLYDLDRFRQIKLERQEAEDNKINLFIVVEERKLLEGMSFNGNKAIKTKKIKEQLNLGQLETIDEEQLKYLATMIKNLYKEENYHLAKINYQIIENKENSDKARVIFSIKEGNKSKIKRIFFTGNKHIPSRKLRTMIFTREDWLFGLLDDSGKYNEESLEMDKKRIEYIYRESGYLTAKVAKVDLNFSKSKRSIDVTFHIKEGEQFIVRNVSAPGDEVFSESELLEQVTVEVGKPYKQSTVLETINRLKVLWGNLGYIHADVYPQVIPNEETKEVDITFHADRGKKVFVNRINISGNKLTKDRVIRRELSIEEGDLLSNQKLGESRDNVEYLGFFERGAVNWKPHKILDNKVDLELNVKETKTGSLNGMLNYGTSEAAPQRRIKGSVNLEKHNLFGLGLDIGASVEGDRKKVRKGSLNFFDPHILDSDVSGAISLYAKQDDYDQWSHVSPTPKERIVGGSLNLGFPLYQISKRTRMSMEFGLEHIKNNNPQVTSAMQRALLQPIVDRTFQQGDHLWFGADLVKDTRNHRYYPTRGFKFILGAKSAPPGLNQEFSFLKTDIEWSWYTPLIGEEYLVLMLHSRIAFIDAISKDKVIPYKELSHMGGQNTVRGFVWGSIGPAWETNDPLGARKAFQFNSELIFPLIPDYSMKGHVFYDCGAGWDTPKTNIPKSDHYRIKRDKFNLRHSVGFGVNLIKPYPAKIDWGYKLDRDKKSGESPSEFHLSMNIPW